MRVSLRRHTFVCARSIWIVSARDGLCEVLGPRRVQAEVQSKHRRRCQLLQRRRIGRENAPHEASQSTEVEQVHTYHSRVGTQDRSRGARARAGSYQAAYRRARAASDSRLHRRCPRAGACTFSLHRLCGRGPYLSRAGSSSATAPLASARMRRM